jgi:hypothetical protein
MGNRKSFTETESDICDTRVINFYVDLPADPVIGTVDQHRNAKGTAIDHQVMITGMFVTCVSERQTDHNGVVRI